MPWINSLITTHFNNSSKIKDNMLIATHFQCFHITLCTYPTSAFLTSLMIHNTPLTNVNELIIIIIKTSIYGVTSFSFSFSTTVLSYKTLVALHFNHPTACDVILLWIIEHMYLKLSIGCRTCSNTYFYSFTIPLSTEIATYIFHFNHDDP